MNENLITGYVNPVGAMQVTSNVAQPQMFTQEQVNSIVASRVNSLNAKITQLQGQVATLTATNTNYVSEIKGYKENEVLNKNNVPELYKDYVRFTAENMVNSDPTKQKTFDVAVQEFMATNQGMFGALSQSVVNQSTVLPTTPVVQPTVQTANVPQINNAQSSGAPVPQINNAQPSGVPVSQPVIQAVAQPQIVTANMINPQPNGNTASAVQTTQLQGINPVAQPQTTQSQPTLQPVGTIPQGMQATQPVNTVDSIVNTFLKSKGFN